MPRFFTFFFVLVSLIIHVPRVAADPLADTLKSVLENGAFVKASTVPDLKIVKVEVIARDGAWAKCRVSTLPASSEPGSLILYFKRPAPGNVWFHNYSVVESDPTSFSRNDVPRSLWPANVTGPADGYTLTGVAAARAAVLEQARLAGFPVGTESDEPPDPAEAAGYAFRPVTVSADGSLKFTALVPQGVPGSNPPAATVQLCLQRLPVKMLRATQVAEWFVQGRTMLDVQIEGKLANPAELAFRRTATPWPARVVDYPVIGLSGLRTAAGREAASVGQHLRLWKARAGEPAETSLRFHVIRISADGEVRLGGIAISAQGDAQPLVNELLVNLRALPFESVYPRLIKAFDVDAGRVMGFELEANLKR